jgi:predicted phosphodiesterase
MAGDGSKPSVPIKVNGLVVAKIGTPTVGATAGDLATKSLPGFGGNVVGFGSTNNEEKPPQKKVDNFANAGSTLKDTVPAPGTPAVQEVPVEVASVPMNVQVLSDLHMENTNYDVDSDITRTAPYLVLAGDIGSCIKDPSRGRYRAWLARQCARFLRVFVILGNNEPKGSGTHANGRDTAITIFRTWVRDPDMWGNLTFMENDILDLQATYGLNVIVLGCTLWSRIRQSQPNAGSDDTNAINGWNSKTNNEVFEDSYRWLKDQVSEIRSGVRKSARILVITHHAPCFGTSIPSQDKEGERWSAYQNDILGGEGVEGLQMGDVWVFGHTHFCCDFFRDEVRVYSNPRGRHGEAKPGYSEGKVITI